LYVLLMCTGVYTAQEVPLWEPEVVEGRWVRPPCHRRLVAHAVNVIRRCPGFHSLPGQVQHLPAQQNKKRAGCPGGQMNAKFGTTPEKGWAQGGQARPRRQFFHNGEKVGRFHKVRTKLCRPGRWGPRTTEVFGLAEEHPRVWRG